MCGPDPNSSSCEWPTRAVERSPVAHVVACLWDPVGRTTAVPDPDAAPTKSNKTMFALVDGKVRTATNKVANRPRVSSVGRNCANGKPGVGANTVVDEDTPSSGPTSESTGNGVALLV